MPTLYTSLLARRRGTASLAPKKQVLPVPRKIASLDASQFRTFVAEQYAGYEAKQVEAQLPKRKIAIIGAGLAGLSAAYELRMRGYTISIFEASNRPGGRTLTVEKVVDHHKMDGGAELIGSNHALWLAYGHTFKLGFSEVREYADSPIVVGNRRLSPRQEKRLLKQMDEALDYISAHSKMIVDPFAPWSDPHAPTLDQVNVRSFIGTTRWPALCKRAVIQQLESDNGVAAEKQSLLALLAMVKGGGMERYWLDTEVYRCSRGTQALSFALEAALGGMGTSIKYGSPITEIDASGNKVVLTADGNPPIEFDDAILTVPPSAWDGVRVWRPNKLASFVGAPPQMGKNTKALLGFHRRFWKSQRLGPSSTQNGPIDQTWETTESHRNPDFGMVAFSGADDAARLSQMSDDIAKQTVIRSLEKVYRHTGTRLRGFRFMNWPSQPWISASYSFPDCGDIMRWGRKFDGGYAGKLHFAGEHTCYAFTGYMEGALQSGYRLARKLVLRDDGAW
jgi:monoamine oxidase